MRVDAHVHVWDPAFPTHPDHPLPPIPGETTDLINNMDVAGIEKAIIVQPINYMFDHTYVQAAVRAFPTRLFGVALANTKGAPEVACDEMDVLVQNGFRGFRINPNFTGDTFKHESVLAVLKRASELDVPVALFAKPKHVPELEYLVQVCPNAKIILDHFAFATPGDRSAQEAVIDVVRRHSNVFIKTSAWFRVSKTEWPHNDLHSFLDDLILAAGPERLMWGSDYPFVKEQYEYSKAFSLIPTALKHEDRAWVQGQTAQRLYKL